MRQAVPLVKTRAPLIGTGMEKTVARDSGATIVAKRDGTVVAVDAERIVVKTEAEGDDSVTEVGADVDILHLKNTQDLTLILVLTKSLSVTLAKK